MKVYLDKFVAYLKNTDDNLTIGQFDEDWEPVGPSIRSQLVDQGQCAEVDGIIRMRNDTDPKPPAQGVSPTSINSREGFGKI